MYPLIKRIIYKLTQPSLSITDEYRRKQVRLINAIVLIFVPLAIFAGISHVILLPSDVPVYQDTAIIMVTIAGILLSTAALSGRFVGYWSMIIIVFLTGYGIIMLNAMLDTPDFFDATYIILLSVLASALFDARIMIGIALLEIISIIILLDYSSPVNAVNLTIFLVVSNLIILFTTQFRNQLERERNQKLAESESFLRKITDELPVSVWITDTQLKRRATFGRMPADSRLDTIPDRKSIQAYQTALAGQSSQFESQQGEHYYQYHVEPMRDDSNDIVGTLGVATDITAQKLAQKQALELDLERERVEMLSTFIEYSSHDLRTPISNINTYLYLLSKSVTSEKEHGYIQVIRDQSTRLHNLIENMLMLQRLELGKTDDFTDVSLKSLLGEIEVTSRSRVEKAGITFVYDVEDKHVILSIQAQQMSVALSKIIENAIQYTDAGGTIRLGCVFGKNAITIAIADTGQGISEEHLPHIFDMFYRGDMSRSAATGDNGLGLTIAKRVIEAHRGTIRVDSEVGIGTAVSITLPAIYI